MIKRMIYVGLLLLAISIVLYYSVYSSLVNLSNAGYAQNITRVYDNFTLTNNSVGTFRFLSHPGNSSVYVVRSSAPIDVFLLNATGYNGWKSLASNTSTTANDLEIAKALEGKGALILYANVTNATVPVSFVKPLYAQNDSNLSLGILGHGMFYVLSTISPYSNTRKATVNSTIALNISIGNSLDKAKSLGYVGAVATLMLVVSFIVILVGILRQDKSKQKEELKPEVVDELYKGIKNSSSAENSSDTKKQHKSKKRIAE